MYDIMDIAMQETAQQIMEAMLTRDRIVSEYRKNGASQSDINSFYEAATAEITSAYTTAFTEGFFGKAYNRIYAFVKWVVQKLKQLWNWIANFFRATFPKLKKKAEELKARESQRGKPFDLNFEVEWFVFSKSLIEKAYNWYTSIKFNSDTDISSNMFDDSKGAIIFERIRDGEETINSERVTEIVTTTKKAELTKFKDISSLSAIIQMIDFFYEWQKKFQIANDHLEREQFLPFMKKAAATINDEKDKTEQALLKKGFASLIGIANGLKAYFPKALELINKILDEIDKHNKE